jgi:ribosome-associated protein
VAEISYLSDYFVMMTGYSKVQVRAIADAIQGQVEIDWQRRPLRTEGKAEGTWVLQDYGDVIVHIMMPREREFYNLEAFWGHAERIPLPNSNNIGG